MSLGLGLLLGFSLVACADDLHVAPSVDDAGGVVTGGGEDGASEAGKDAAVDAPVQVVDAQPPPQCDGTKRPDQDACVIADAFGIFVSSSLGNDLTGNGSRALPFATLGHAIVAAKQANRRVYACAETYTENVDFADGVDIYGYFDCTSSWKTTQTRARTLAPKSPAATATKISKDTRIDSLEIVAPDVSSPGASSIGLLANDAGGLHFVNAKIHAGAAGKGDDGTAGIQLVATGNPNGRSGSAETYCNGGFSCENFHDSQSGGTMTCVGEVGHDPAPGGNSGSGGYYTLDQPLQWVFVANTPKTGTGMPSAASVQVAKGGTFNVMNGDWGGVGAAGSPGAVGPNLGYFGVAGYSPANGTKGTAGSPGQSGGGGSGGAPGVLHNADFYAKVDVGAWGSSGGSGGAGGCPGLPGTPGKSGGASIGILAITSALTLDGSTVESSTGGAGGSNGLRSQPTGGASGGAGPMNQWQILGGNGGGGGTGGAAGSSGGGGGGPSIALVYSSAATPKTVGSTFSQGKGGTGAPAKDGAPAAPDGLSVDKLSFVYN